MLLGTNYYDARRREDGTAMETPIASLPLARLPAGDNARDDRRTIIPTPRSNKIFPGWGVRL